MTDGKSRLRKAVIDRALELAESGTCSTIKQVSDQLEKGGYSKAREHLPEGGWLEGSGVQAAHLKGGY